MQAELQVAPGDLSQAILFTEDLEDTPIPQHHATRAVVAFGDIALELTVLEGMIFHQCRERLFGRVQSRTLRYRPRLQRPAKLQAKVVMQVRGTVPLHKKTPRVRCTRLCPARLGFRRSAEITFRRVLFKGHKRLEMFSFHVIANMRVYG